MQNQMSALYSQSTRRDCELHGSMSIARSLDSGCSKDLIVLTSALRNVWKPLKPALLSTCTLGVDLRASRPSPGVPARVLVLLSRRLGQACPSAWLFGTGMLMECPKETPLLDGVPCTALMFSSKPVRSCKQATVSATVACVSQRCLLIL